MVLTEKFTDSHLCSVTEKIINFYYEISPNCFCFRMLMLKKNHSAINEHLFKEGVVAAKKDHHAPKHPELEKGVCPF